MNWRNFLPLKGEPVKSDPPVSIPVKQFGIAKVVFVRTKGNGGIVKKKINVRIIE